MLKSVDGPDPRIWRMTILSHFLMAKQSVNVIFLNRWDEFSVSGSGGRRVPDSCGWVS